MITLRNNDASTIRAILMLAIVTNVALSAFAQSPALQSFVGKDLQKLSDDELAPLLTLLGKKQEEPLLTLFGPSPWYVWATTKSMPKRLLVFEGQRISTIPGISSAQIHIFDESGRKLTECAFSTGWRIDLNRAFFCCAANALGGAQRRWTPITITFGFGRLCRGLIVGLQMSRNDRVLGTR